MRPIASSATQLGKEREEPRRGALAVDEAYDFGPGVLAPTKKPHACWDGRAGGLGPRV